MTGTITVFYTAQVSVVRCQVMSVFFPAKRKGALMKNMTRQKSNRRTLENAKTLFVR